MALNDDEKAQLRKAFYDNQARVQTTIWALVKAESHRAVDHGTEALSRARAGDWHLLGLHVADDRMRITREMRQFISEVLRGKRPRPSKKISKFETELTKAKVVDFVLDARVRGTKNAVELAAKKFGRTPRQVSRDLAECKNMVSEIRSCFDAFDHDYVHIRGIFYELFNKDGSMPRYFGMGNTAKHFCSPDDI